MKDTVKKAFIGTITVIVTLSLINGIVFGIYKIATRERKPLYTQEDVDRLRDAMLAMPDKTPKP